MASHAVGEHPDFKSIDKTFFHTQRDIRPPGAGQQQLDGCFYSQTEKKAKKDIPPSVQISDKTKPSDIPFRILHSSRSLFSFAEVPEDKLNV